MGKYKIRKSYRDWVHTEEHLSRALLCLTRREYITTETHLAMALGIVRKSVDRERKIRRRNDGKDTRKANKR